MQNEFFAVYDNGMACIASALIPYDYIKRLGEYINDLTFTFVPPLETDKAGIKTHI